MNSVDLILLFILSLFALRGFFKGLFREMFSLLGLSLGLMVAVRYNETVSALWQDFWGPSPLIPKIITFIALFIAVYTVLTLLGWLAHLSTHFTPLKGVNRMGGVMLGTGKGAVLLGLALFFTISSPMIPGQMKRKVNDSSLAPSLYRFGEGIFEAGKDKLFVRSGSSGRRGRDSRSY